jgi:ribonuclease P protein component
MIHRTHRFHGRTSLRFVYSNGQTIRCSHSALKYARNTRRQTYRVAVVVSRKVSKSAVVRNRIRRRMYEAMAACAPHINDPYDMVFTVFSDQLATIEYEDLFTTVKTQLQKAGIMMDFDEPSSENRAIVEN